MATGLNILALMKQLKYFFEDDEQNYNIYETNQQYQSFSNKALLPLDEYLKKN